MISLEDAADLIPFIIEPCSDSDLDRRVQSSRSVIHEMHECHLELKAAGFTSGSDLAQTLIREAVESTEIRFNSASLNPEPAKKVAILTGGLFAH